MHTRLKVPVFNSNRMTVEVDRESRIITMTAEASSLGLVPGQVPYGRMFSDSCDVGCVLHSGKTGQHHNMFLCERTSNSTVWSFQGRHNDYAIWLHIFNT